MVWRGRETSALEMVPCPSKSPPQKATATNDPCLCEKNVVSNHSKRKDDTQRGVSSALFIIALPYGICKNFFKVFQKSSWRKFLNDTSATSPRVPR